MTTVAYGYRSCEVELPPLPEVKDDVKFRLLPNRLDVIRPIVRSSLGCHVLGGANPHPDPSDLETMLDGASRRFCRKPPTPNANKMDRFKKFVLKWLKKHMVPLPSSTDTSFETWIQNTPYPLWRKNELIKKWEESKGFITSENIVDYRGMRNRYVRVNSFQKDETYPVYKAARGINSRTDEFKVRVGPVFKLIEEQLFKMEYFIKHTPVDERAQEIKDKLYQAGAHIIGTDYTSFESLFTEELMMACEMQLYSYMTQNIDDSDWYKIVEYALTGTNKCYFRNKFVISVSATRMSGEMCTSLGNSFTNFMAMKFIAKEIGMRSLKSRIEGDDGIFTFYGPKPTAQDFADIGLIIKIDEYESLTEGSFCGIIADEHEMINVTDPIDVLLNFGWTTRDYALSGVKKKLELLKAKSLSLAYQYPGCPILSSLADYGLRICKDSKYSVKDMNEYERLIFLKMHEKYKNNIPRKQVGYVTRLLVEKRYGITVDDQLIIESYLDNKTELSPIESQAILSNCHKDAIDYFDKFVVDWNNNRFMDCPVGDDYSLKKVKSIFEIYEPANSFEEESFGESYGEKKGETWRKKISGERNFDATKRNNCCSAKKTQKSAKKFKEDKSC